MFTDYYMSIELYSFLNGTRIFIREVSIEEYSKYKYALEYVISFSNFIDLYLIFSMNYDDYFYELGKQLENYKSERKINYSLYHSSVNRMNRAILNYACSFRTYIDHLKNLIKKRGYSEKSLKDTVLKKLNDLYNNNLTYNFFYILRNYCQHEGMLIGKISFSEKMDEKVKTKVHYDLKFIILSKHLLGNYDSWGDKIIKMLKENEEIDLSSLIKEIHDIIYNVHNEFVSIEKETLNKYLSLSNKFHVELNADDSEVYLVINSDGHTETKYITNRFYKRITSLLKK